MSHGAAVRPARTTDLAAIRALYAWHVEHGLASFEEAAPDAAEMARRFAEVQAHRLPWLVVEANGALAGYAYATLYRTRPAYRYTCEDSIYIAPGAQGRGHGRALLAALIAAAAAAGFRQMVAVIGDSANAASIRVHEALGFRHVGVLAASGFKFGRWVDAVLMQRELGPGAASLP